MWFTNRGVKLLHLVYRVFQGIEDLRGASQAFIRCVNQPLLCCKGFMGALQQCCAAPCVCVCVFCTHAVGGSLGV